MYWLKNSASFSFILLLMMLGLVACDADSALINKPVAGSQFQEGQDISVQTYINSNEVLLRVELLMDDKVVASEPVPGSQKITAVNQAWKAQPGLHTFTVRAFNSANTVITSQSVTVTVIAVPSISLANPPIPPASGGLTTTLPTVGGVTTPLTTTLPTVGGPTATLTTTLPTTTTVSSSANPPVAPPAAANPPAAPACPGPPVIASFTASPNPIKAGDATTLAWGAVTNASSASIDQNIGGIPAPGNRSVSPAKTTTYSLTATGCGGTVTKQVTVTVNPAPSSTPTPTPTPTRKEIGRCSIKSESGYILKTAGNRIVTDLLRVGDDTDNGTFRTFVSFDIRDIALKTLDSARLEFNGGITIEGNPFATSPTGLGPLQVEVLDYGTLEGPDYDAPGNQLLSLSSNPRDTQHDIRSSIQSAANASKARFQLRLRFSGETNSNNAIDRLSWLNNGNICLAITFH